MVFQSGAEKKGFRLIPTMREMAFSGCQTRRAGEKEEGGEGGGVLTGLRHGKLKSATPQYAHLAAGTDDPG